MHRTILFYLAALAAAGIAVCGWFLYDLSAARERIAGRGRVFDTPFGTQEYAQMGEGASVLIVHGAAGGFDQGFDMAGVLAERGYRLIAPSRFGYLGSHMPDEPAVVKQADVYAALLDKLGVDKAFVVAISAGAWSAMQFAIRHPERCRALVLLVPANYLPPQQRNHGGLVARAMFASDFLAWLAVKLTVLMPGALARIMLGTDADVLRDASPEERARAAKILNHLLPIGERGDGTAFDIDTAATREQYALDKITCPVLAISTEDDAFGTALRAREVVAGVRNGRLIVYPTGGHAMIGRTDEALGEVASVFETIAGSERPVTP